MRAVVSPGQQSHQKYRGNHGEIWNRVGTLSSRQTFNDLSTSLLANQKDPQYKCKQFFFKPKEEYFLKGKFCRFFINFSYWIKPKFCLLYRITQNMNSKQVRIFWSALSILYSSLDCRTCALTLLWVRIPKLLTADFTMTRINTVVQFPGSQFFDSCNS